MRTAAMMRQERKIEHITVEMSAGRHIFGPQGDDSEICRHNEILHGS
jgi:hypothetical protein